MPEDLNVFILPQVWEEITLGNFMTNIFSFLTFNSQKAGYRL